jgi:hypothetical protein
MVVLMSNARIWGLVLVPKRFVFISLLFLGINLTFVYLQPLRVGTLWYLHVHIGDERFRWIKCKAVLFRSQLPLTWVEAGGGQAIISLYLLNWHEVRSMPSPNHASAWDDIGKVATRAQALDKGGAPGGIKELCPFQMMYEDGVERLGAGSPRERMKWVGAIWYVFFSSFITFGLLIQISGIRWIELLSCLATRAHPLSQWERSRLNVAMVARVAAEVEASMGRPRPSLF